MELEVVTELSSNKQKYHSLRCGPRGSDTSTSWRVKQGRDTCAACGQIISRWPQKSRSGRESDDGSAQGYVGVLGKWRQVVKDGVASTSTLRTWWRSCSDDCAIPQRCLGSARCIGCAPAAVLTAYRDSLPSCRLHSMT